MRSGLVPLSLMLVVTALCGVLAAVLEVQAGLSTGHASVMVLTLPVALTAARNGLRDGIIVGLLAAVACGVGGGLGVAARSDASWLMPAIGALGMVVLGTGLGFWSSHLQRGLRAQSDRAHELARQIYQMKRKQQEARETAPPEAPPEAPEPHPPEPTVVDYSQLLLKVQDIGKAITSALDLETIGTTVPETARKLLGARQSQLYLLDESGRWLEPCGDQLGSPIEADKGLFGWAIEHRQVLTRDLAEKDYHLRGLLDGQTVPCDAAVPLVVGRDVLGLVNVADLANPPEQIERLLRILANFASLGVRNARLFQRIQDLAKRDGLTGLFNHATFQEELAKVIAETLGGGGACSVVLSDVDHFKRFNDTHGHQAGDFVLKRIAAILTDISPANGMVARYGGEEFVLLLPETTADQACRLAERFRQSVADAVLRYRDTVLRVTASVGVASCPVHARTASDLIQRADEAMYAAKEAGRNAVRVAEPVLVA